MAIMHLRFAGRDTLKGYQHLMPAQARAAANRDVADRAPSTGRDGALHLFTDPALSLTRPISSVMIAYRHPGSSAIFIVMTDTGSELPFTFRPAHRSITH